MENIRTVVVSFLAAIGAYLNPVNGELKSLLAIFMLNFVFGYLAGMLANHERFMIKKAMRCIGEATIFFVLVCSLYFIGEHKGNTEGAMQCISFVTYVVFYFYMLNILRNILFLTKKGSTAYNAISLIYYLFSVEFIRNIPAVEKYLNIHRKNGR